MNDPARSAERLWLVLACLLVPAYLFNLGAVEFFSSDESRSGVIVRDMIEGGRWLLPRTPDGNLCEKPLVYYWMAAGLAKLVGTNEWALRLPSVAMAVGTLALVWVLAGLYGSRRASLIAVVALGSNFIFMAWARKAMVDMTFTFFCTAGLTAYFAARQGRLRPWPAAALGGVAIGLAVLSKGPLGLALPAAVVAADVLVETRGRFWRARVPWGPAAVACVLTLAVALAWYVPAWSRGGREFLQTSVLSENFYMPAGEARGLGVSHRKSLFLYPGLQIAIVLSMAALLPEVIRWMFRRGAGAGRSQMGAWFAGGFAIFMIAANKRSYYLLPIQPAVAAMIGIAIDRRLDDAESGPLLSWGGRVTGILIALGGAAGMVAGFKPSMLETLSKSQVRIGSAAPFVVAFSLVVIAVGVRLLVSAKRPPLRLTSAALAAALLAPASLSWVYDAVQSQETPSRKFVSESYPRIPPGVRPAVVETYGDTIEFYWPDRLVHDERAAERPGWFLLKRDRIKELTGSFEEVGVWKNPWGDREVVLVRRR